MTVAISKVNLSPEQKSIVDYQNGEGALLVVAAAGSGKTRILTERARYLLTQKKGRFAILCLTFTNKAAEEMQERLKDVPDIKRRSFIGTLHGFALKIVISRRTTLGYEEVPHILERENDRKKILEQVFLENPILRVYYIDKDVKTQQHLINEYMNWISEQKRNLVIVDDDTPQYGSWHEHRLMLYKSYNRLLRGQNMVDYDDILLLAYRVLSENEAIARLYQDSYPYILVDEAQDLSYAQYHLIKAIVGEAHKNIFMVGDPNQAINSYAGADKKFMLENFVEDYDATKKKIEKNYRSSQEVIKFANKLLPNGSHPEDAYYEGVAEVLDFENEIEEATWIYNKIKAMLNRTDETWILRGNEIEGELTLDKIVVLARNRFVFNKLEELLKQDGVLKDNYFVKKSTEVLDLESDLMKIFDLGTRIISNPSNQLHFQQILNYLKISAIPQYKNEKGIEKLSQLKSFLPVNDEKVHSDFEILLQSWQILSNNLKEMNKALELLEKYADTLNDESERDLVLNDINVEYKNTWQKFVKETPSSNINLSMFRQFLAMGVSNASKQKGLTLATVHTAKGLGFDIVFLMGMVKGTFPDYRAKNAQQLEEEKNTAYVAVTRAKRWLFVTYPKKKMTSWGEKIQIPSSFIV